MEYVRKDIPLWSITIWDKKFNNVEKEWQPEARKYKYLLADELDSLKVENGDIRILYTGKDTGFTTEELAGDAIAEGEVVTIPWGGIPTVKYHKGKFVTGDNRIATSSDTSLLTNKYLYYYMKGNTKTLASFYRGASLKHPSMRDVLKMSISFPSVEEQNRIVKQFDYLERLIELRQQELQKLDELVKARFVELFGDPFDIEKWPVSDLKDISESLIDGSNIDPNYYESAGEVLFLRIQNVWRNEFRLDDSVFVSQKVNQEYYDTSLKTGDLLITKIGRYYTKDSSLGRVAVYRGKNDGANYSNNIMRVRLKPSMNSEFVNVLLNLDDYQTYIRHTSKGGTDKRALSKSLIGSYPIIVPPKSMQDDFADFVKQLDKSKVIENNACRCLKYSLMPGLMAA